MLPLDCRYEPAALFALERARLIEALHGLSGPGWNVASPCPGWTVADVVNHLVGDDLGLLARQRDGHHGTPGPEGDGRDALDAWIDQLQDGWVNGARRISPRLAIELLAWMGPEVVDLFRHQDRSALAGHVSWAADGPVPRWLDQMRELSEMWIHRQQILQATGSPEDQEADLLVPVLYTLNWAYPYRLRSVRRPAGTSISFFVGPPADTEWHLVATRDDWAHQLEPSGPTAATASMTASQAWRVLTNNLPVPERDGLELTGDREITEILLSTRAVLGTPS